MAIIGTNQEEKDPNAPAGTPAGGSAAMPSTGGGGGAGYVGGGAGQGPSGATPAATSSGSYTNLGSYLGANQGGAAQMTGTVKGVLDASGNEAKTAIDKYGTTGKADAAAGTAKADPGFDAQVKSGYNAATGVYSGPTAPTAKYSGLSDPTKVTGYGAAQTAYQGLTDKLGAAGGGQAGVAGLLKGAYQQPSYTQGENNLDSFLAGGTAGGQQMLKGAQDQWGGQGKNLAATTQGVGSAQTAGQRLSDQVGKDQAAAVKAQQDQAAAWKPFVASDGANVQVPTIGTTSDFVPAAKAPGGPGDPNPGIGPNAFEIGYKASQAASKAAKDTSPGQLNHDAVGSGAGGAGAPIQGPGADPNGSYQQLQNVLSQTSPGNVNSKVGGSFGKAAHKYL